jgi:hypothetical protein
VAELRKASLQAASQGMDDDLLVFAAGPPSPPAREPPADPVERCAEGSKPGEDVRETATRQLDATWSNVRQLLARTAFEPYETGRPAALLEQAAAAAHTEMNRRTAQPLARCRPLVLPPPQSQEGGG